MGQAPPAQAGLLGIKVSQQQGVKQKIRRDFGVSMKKTSFQAATPIK